MKNGIHNSFRVTLLVVFSLLLFAVTHYAQPEVLEKIEKARTLFSEAHSIAETEAENSWPVAEAKFEESYAMLLDASPDHVKATSIKEFVTAFRQLIGAHFVAKKYILCENLTKFVLRKARVANLKHETALLLQDLGNIELVLNKATGPELLKESIPLFTEVGDLKSLAAVNRLLGLVAYDNRKFDETISYMNEALRLSRTVKDRTMEAEVTYLLGDTYYSNNKYKESEFHFKESLTVFTELQIPEKIALASVAVGKVQYLDYLAAEESAVNFLKAIEIARPAGMTKILTDAEYRLAKSYMIAFRNDDARQLLLSSIDGFIKLGDNFAAADARMLLGKVLLIRGDIIGARDQFQRSLSFYDSEKHPRGKGLALVNLASLYNYQNEHQKGLDLAQEARLLFSGLKDNEGQFAAAETLASLYTTTSRFSEALVELDIAERLADEMKDARRKTEIIVSRGIIESTIGANEKAIKFYRQAIELTKITKDKRAEAIILSNIGYNFYALDDLKQARTNLVEAVAKLRTLKMRRETGYALHNLGMVEVDSGNLAEANSRYREALDLYVEVKDRRPEAYLYLSLAEIAGAKKNWDEAISEANKAILLAREIRYDQIEGYSLSLMMRVWRERGVPRLAALYGKQAVNVFQGVRELNRGLEKSQLASFLKKNEATYRELADHLVAEGRLPEAQQVLDLLKEEEYLDFVRRDASEASDQAKLALTDSERKALDEYSRLSTQLTALGSRFQVLQNARSNADGKLSATDEAEFQKLKTQIEDAGVGIRTFLAKLAAEFSKTVEDKAIITPDSIETLRADLRSVGSDVVLVSTYMLPERYRAIVTTGGAMVDRKVEYKDRKLTAADINRKIDEFRRALQNPKVDPRPMGKELYDIFVKPLENDLKGAGAKTILWSLDGTLRYIPIAALSPDGKTYLAERYQNVIVTLGRQSKLFDDPTEKEWRALGAGVSKQHEGFAALPSVIKEINSIVKENGSGGVLDGKKLIDEKFDLAAFENSVPQKTVDGKGFNIIHLATHFKLGMNDRDSALLLGDGKRLSLFEIGKNESLDFKNVELLALSACETGVSAGDKTGREVESLGMLAQKKGAKSVLATLWKVADEGTSMFMSEFYRLKLANPKMSKSEAIRLTQKAMIDGKIKASGTGTSCRADEFVDAGKKDEFRCDPNAPFSHPYFWSPFVLIGNWR